MSTTWSARLLDVAFVVVLVFGVVAVLAALVGAKLVVIGAASLVIVGGLLAVPGIVRGEMVWWLRR